MAFPPHMLRILKYARVTVPYYRTAVTKIWIIGVLSVQERCPVRAHACARFEDERN